jgi:polar amino acid transport system substrate-binding protein
LVNAQTITLTYENINSFPWHLTEEKGLDLILLKMVDNALPEVIFQYQQAPWKRCLNNIKNNISEGCFSTSFKKKRKAFGYYPGGDTPKESQRIHSSSYSLYVLNQSNINVTGKLTISGLNGKVAAPAGYSIVKDLINMGYSVDAGAISTDRNFEKLLRGRVDAVAALTPNGNNILSKNKNYSDKIHIIKTPLISMPYYILFSKKFVNSNKAMSEKIWKTIEKVRESQEFKDAASDFISK